MTDYKYFLRDNPPAIPAEVAVCPICGAGIYIDIDEWEEDTGRVTEFGLHVDCVTEPDIDSDDWNDWHRWHWSMPYVDWLPVQVKVYAWLDRNYRVQCPNLPPGRPQTNANEKDRCE